jgi:hypothetical protein
MALSVERFLEVADKNKRFTKLRNKIKLKIISIYMGCVWLFAFLFSLPIVISIELVQLADNSYMCETNWTEVTMNSFFSIKFVCIFILPFTIILFTSVKLLVFITKQKNALACQKKTLLMAENIALNSVKKDLEKKTSSNTNVTVAVVNRVNTLKGSKNLRTNSNIKEMINKRINKKRNDSRKKRRLRSHSKAIKMKAIKIVLSIVFLFIIQWYDLFLSTLNFLKQRQTI